jgi:DNA-binding response OmpR family regulator
MKWNMVKQVLLVDDEKSIRESLNKVLRTEGYEVVLAEDGQEAIQMLVQKPIDILILDIGLPVKDGWATLRWLNQVNPFFPVILITGRWKQAELAEAAGVDVLMEKPLNVPLLLQHIRELLQELPETRGGKRTFRSVSCDIEKFCEQMLKRLTTPYPSGGPHHSKYH